MDTGGRLGDLTRIMADRDGWWWYFFCECVHLCVWERERESQRNTCCQVRLDDDDGDDN